MLKFSERLNELIEDREISIEKLASNINVSLQTVYGWKSGKHQIYLSNLISLCDYLRCSIDFIAGRKDVELDFKPINPPNFHTAIKAVMAKNNITTYRLRKDTRYVGSYFSRWSKGEEPNFCTLIELADYFNCTIDELVGREK